MSDFVCKEELLSNLLEGVSLTSGVPTDDLTMETELVGDLELNDTDLLIISSGLSDFYEVPLDIADCDTIEEAYAHLRTLLSC